MNSEQITTEQIDHLISTLQSRKKAKKKLIEEYQAAIDKDYKKPVEVRGPTTKMDAKTFWTMNIRSIDLLFCKNLPICFCCMEEATFEIRDKYSKYELCYSCGKEVISRTGFPPSRIGIGQ